MADAVVLQSLLQSRLHASSCIEEPTEKPLLAHAVALLSLLQGRLHAASFIEEPAEKTM